MSFLKNLFGKGEQNPAQAQTRPESKQVTGKEDIQVYAVALVTDLSMLFDSDETLNDWVANVLHTKWEGVKLPPKAQIEVEAGFTSSDDEAKTKLEPMLQQALATANLEPHKYEKEFFSVQGENLPMKVWCAVAVKPQMQKGTYDTTTTHFIGTLNSHLQYLRGNFPQFAPFLDQNFSDAIVVKIASMAVEKMKLTQADGKQHSIVLYLGAVVYNISTLPVDMEQAKDWYVRRFGGYAEFLPRAVQAAESQGTDSSVWCHIICGWTKKGSWVNMAICPIKQPAPIKTLLMPIEFLTPEERRYLGL
jgi:hypothetical protein